MPEVIVEASQATSVRQVTPTTAYPDPEVLVVDGTGGAVIHALIDLDLIPPIGEDAEVIGAFLQLYRAEAFPAGDKSVTTAPLDDDFDQETATFGNAPAVRTPSSTDPAVPGGGQAGDVDEFDITPAYSESVGADNAEASRWYGVKVTTTFAGVVRWYSMFADPDLVPQLRLVYSVPAEAPSELFPADERHVGEAKPYIGAHYNGNDETEEMAAFQVEVATDDTFDGTVVFDSGERATSAPELDLAGEVGFTALTAGQTRYHRWRTKNIHGSWSPWSDPAAFTFTTKISIVIDAPVLDIDDTTDEVTPTVAWTVTNGPQEAFEIEILRRNDQGVLIPHWEQPRTVSTDTAVTVPDAYGLQPGVEYRAYVRVWDAVDRAELPGAPSYYEAVLDFTLRDLVAA